MSDAGEEAQGQQGQSAVRRLRRHALAYGAGNALLLVIDLVAGGEMWIFWPLFGWGIVLGFHYLYVRSTGVDDSWVQRRADDVRYKSYDLQHIRDIEERHEKGETQVPPRARPKG